MSRIILLGPGTVLKELIDLNGSLEYLFLEFISLDEYGSRLLVMIAVPRLEQLLAGLVTLIDDSDFLMKLFELPLTIGVIEFPQVLIKRLYPGGLNKMDIEAALQIQVTTDDSFILFEYRLFEYFLIVG
jgi:hypothetical protein